MEHTSLSLRQFLAKFRQIIYMKNDLMMKKMNFLASTTLIMF